MSDAVGHALPGILQQRARGSPDLPSIDSDVSRCEAWELHGQRLRYRAGGGLQRIEKHGMRGILPSEAGAVRKVLS